jgi:hypothetical protein
MKKILFVLILTLATFAYSYAQKVTGSFRNLENQVRVKLVIDFSEADIMGMSEGEFYQFEEDWAHDKVEVFSLFYNYANEELKGIFAVGNYKTETDYVLRLVVHTVDVRGDYDSDLILLYSGEEIARAEGIYARGGKFGSKLNLMKDGAEHTGTAIGKFLKKQISAK